MPTNGNTFDWTGREADLNTLVKETSKEIRVSRPMFKPWGQPNGFTGTVQAHKVSAGPPLFVDSNQALTPVELACEFQTLCRAIYRRRDDPHAGRRGRIPGRSGRGRGTPAGSAAAEFLKNLGVQERNLQSQSGLFQEQTGQVKQPILDSIIQGIKGLQKKGASASTSRSCRSTCTSKRSSRGRTPSMLKSMRSVRYLRKTAFFGARRRLKGQG